MPRDALRPLERVRITSPCSAEWDEMEGNDRVRFCRHCSLHVHHTAQMTPAQAFNLVLRSPGRLCLRFHRRPDGSLVTRPPARPLYQIRRRVSRLAAGAFGAALSLCSAAAAQAQTASPTTTATVTDTRDTAGQGSTPGSLTGTVRDEAGAIAAGVTATLVNTQTGAERHAVTDPEGVYRFDVLAPGEYKLRFPRPEGGPTERDIYITPTALERTEDVQLGTELVTLGGVVEIVEPSEPMVRAAWADDLTAVKTLLAEGADANVVDKDLGLNALAVAVGNNNREMVVELLRSGADANARLSYRQTALMRLTPNTSPEVIRELLLAGAKVNVRDEDGNTPLMSAAGWASEEVIELLLKAGARVNARNKAGETPLMYAARAGSKPNTQALLSAGADLERRNNDGSTALKLAHDYEHKEIADLLIAYGALDDEARPVSAEAAPPQP